MKHYGGAASLGGLIKGHKEARRELTPNYIVELVKSSRISKLKFLSKKLNMNLLGVFEIVHIIKLLDEERLKIVLPRIDLYSPRLDFSKLNARNIKSIIEQRAKLKDTKLVGCLKLILERSTNGKALLGFNNMNGYWSSNLLKSVEDVAENVISIPLKYSLTGNERYLSIFDAFINPGASDSFNEYGETDISYLETNKLEEHELSYHNVVAFARHHHKPYLGICNGAQHLILNEGGSVSFVEEESDEIILEPGSIVHFFAMSLEEQSIALQYHMFPEIQFYISIAHNYAGVNDKLGNVELGGVSLTGVVEAVASNFYQIGFQFHPEDRYKFDTRNFNLLDNVFRIFSAAKTTDMVCMDSYMSRELYHSISDIQYYSSDPYYNFTGLFLRDLLQEAIYSCHVQEL